MKHRASTFFARGLCALALACAASTASAQVLSRLGDQRITVGFTSQGFWGLYASWDCLVAPETRLGVFYHASALQLVRLDFDAGEVGLVGNWRRDFGDGVGGVTAADAGESPAGSGRPSALTDCFAELSLEAGYRYQGQNLGFAQSVFSRLTGKFGRELGPFSPALKVGWEQTWLTHIRYSPFVTATFADRYDGCAGAPSSATVFLPATRLRLGLDAAIRLPREAELSLGGGFLWAPNPFVGGFDGMMFGHFPFYAELAARLPL